MTKMLEEVIAWAPWHPERGFQDLQIGPVGDMDIDRCCREVNYLNEYEGTDNRTGWRAVKVKITRFIEEEPKEPRPDVRKR